MKKIKYVILVLILVVSTVVKASSDNTNTSLSIDCGKNEFASSNKLTCDVNLNYSDTDITDIEFSYASPLTLAFAKAEGVMNVSNGKVKVTFSNPLSAAGTKKISIAKITVTAGNSIKTGNYDINLTDVKINTETPVSLNNAKQTVSYIAAADLEIDCSLNSITINGTPLSGFSKTKYNYTGLTSGQKVVNIEAERTSKESSVTGVGQSFLRGDSNTINIEVNVAPESLYKCAPSSRTYTLVISYVEGATSIVAEKSTDNTLSQLELYNGTDKLDFSFDAKKASFDYKVAGDVEKLTVKATLNNEKATFVSKYGPRDIKLNYGKNKIEVRVKSESEATKTYTLNVEREDTRSSDNTLSILSIGGIDVSLVADQYEYEVNVPLSVSNTDVSLQTTNSNAKAEYKDIDLVDGENNLSIKVTSENGKAVEYKIKINRIEIQEEQHLLENITITGYDFPFQKDITTYDLTINKDTNSLAINVIPTENIETTILGNENLTDNSTIIIRVSDDEGEKSYTINIHKKSDSSILNIICYSVFGVGLIALIGAIIYSNKKKKKQS